MNREAAFQATESRSWKKLFGGVGGFFPSSAFKGKETEKPSNPVP